MPSVGSKFTQSVFIRNTVFGRKQIVVVNCTHTRENFICEFSIVFCLFVFFFGGEEDVLRKISVHLRSPKLRPVSGC